MYPQAVSNAAQENVGVPSWRERLLNWLALAVLVALGVVWPADLAFPAQPADMQAGSLLLKRSTGAEPVEALRVSTRIRAVVTGNVARVHVTQEFRNEGDEWVDGLYVFPLAAGAAVDELEMQVGERRIRGEIRRKAEARATYERARSEGRRASLVEQERPNLFTSSVANIAPRSSISIEIAYLETIPYRDGRYTLHLPLAITPRYTPGANIDAAGPAPAETARVLNAVLGTTATPERVTPQQQKVDIEIELAPGFTLQSLRSLHHRVAVEELPHGRRVHLAGRSVPADRDFELVWSPLVAPDMQAAAFAERVGEATYALVMLTPPEAIVARAPPREVLFIIGTSGSMHGPSIEQAKAALLLGVERLGPGDRFNVIRFSNDASSLFDVSERVDGASQALAQRFIASLTADGGTEMRGALELAFSTTPAEGLLRQIVFITDGAVSNEAELIAMIRARAGEARLFTVGIGAAPNAHFMREASAAGRGSYLFIAEAVQVRERMQDLFLKLERPALVDLELHWPGGIAAELAAAMPSDVYAGDPLVVVARLPDEPQGLLTLSGRTEGGAWVRQLPIRQLGGQPGVAKLWARERIGELGRRKSFDTDAGTTGNAIVALALAHHLVSDYTSLVAVETTPVRPPGVLAREEQASTSGPAGGAWANTTGFAGTATPASLLALLGLGSLLAAAVLVAASWLRRPQLAR
ncbi:MAG TPA: marine proteobacterial sortase target protein [Steroidobacteraceae bacterium]|nr:marine proteobacterial sortase target protein [Steroidobacteraceae bacterium]